MKKQEAKVNERATHASNPKSKSLYPDLYGPEFVDPQFFEKKYILEKWVPPFCDDELYVGFSKVCEIFKVRGIESLKYIRGFHTLV